MVSKHHFGDHWLLFPFRLTLITCSFILCKIIYLFLSILSVVKQQLCVQIQMCVGLYVSYY